MWIGGECLEAEKVDGERVSERWVFILRCSDNLSAVCLLLSAVLCRFGKPVKAAWYTAVSHFREVLVIISLTSRRLRGHMLILFVGR